MLSEPEIREVFERFKEENGNPKCELIAKNDFTFSIAVLLSAQTTDKAVNKATEELFEIADTPQKMIDLGIDTLKDHIKTLGLYNNKAKNVIELSKILVKEYDSKIPHNRNELEKLPGIGRKSANVIMNHLFGENTIAVDTHVLRVSNRIGLLQKTSTNPLEVEENLINIIPCEFHKNASDWLVLHGRYICTSQKPKCDKCFLYDLCEFAN